jgi:energy-coupling factor transporter ATP-binding protein EcfA2
MRIHDLVIQGVRRFRENQRLVFQPAFNVVFGSNESGKSTLLLCLVELLYPDRFRDEVHEMVSWGEVPNSRAGLTVGQDETVFRILRDFKANRISLSRLNRASNKFDPVSEQATEIASLLAENFHLPPFETFRNLFVDEVSRLPSSLPLKPPEVPAPAPAPPAAPAPPTGPTGFGTGFGAGTNFPGQEYSYPAFGASGAMPPGMMPPGMMPPGMMPPGMGMTGMPGMFGTGYPGMPGAAPAEDDDGLSLEEKEKRLEELRGDAAKIQEVEELQFEMDGVQAKIFETQSKKESVKKFDQALGQADEVLDKYPLFRNLPDNIDERVSRFNDLLSIQAREVEKIDQGALDYDEQFRPLENLPPVYQQQLFQIGAGLLGVGLLALILQGAVPALRYLALVVAPGIVLVAYAVWQFINLKGRREEVLKKLQGFDQQRKAIFKKFEVEGAVIQQLMNQADCDSAEELANKIIKYREVVTKRERIEQRKKELMLELDWKRLQAEEEELKQKLSQMEVRLRSQVVAGVDKVEIKREIERLEAAIKRIKPEAAVVATSVPSFGVPDLGGPVSTPAAPAATAAGINSPAAAPAATDPGRTRMDDAVPMKLIATPTAGQAVERLLLAATAILGVEREALLQKIQSRLDLYLQAFSGKLYLAGRFEAGKGLLIQTADSKRWADFGEISPPARDLAYFSLQITLLEILIPKLPLPFLLDDAFRGQDDARRAVLGKALKRLAERTQVLIFTSQRNLVPLADNALNLG